MDFTSEEDALLRCGDYEEDFLLLGLADLKGCLRSKDALCTAPLKETPAQSLSNPSAVFPPVFHLVFDDDVLLQVFRSQQTHPAVVASSQYFLSPSRSASGERTGDSPGFLPRRSVCNEFATEEPLGVATTLRGRGRRAFPGVQGGDCIAVEALSCTR